MSSDATSNAQVIADLARTAARPTIVEGDDGPVGALAYAVPDGGTIDLVDLESYLSKPRRARGCVEPTTVDDLAAYVERHMTTSTTIWVDADALVVTAVLDDHAGPDAPGHGEHRAVLRLATSPEWKHWIDKNCEQFEQSEFAEHIEDGAAEIVEPTAAEMLEIASSFHARSSSVFRSAKRLDNGQVQMKYDEEMTASAGRSGEMVVPSEFALAVAPFIGSPAYRLVARLRYRVSGGKLALSYKLDRPHLVIRHAVSDVASTLGEKFPGIVFLGRPR